MSWNVQLPAKWVYQGDPDGCATASVATVLSALGVRLDDDPTVMTLVRTTLRASVDTWTGPFTVTGNPAGVAGTINRYAPEPVSRAPSQPQEYREYSVFACATPYDACAKIVNALVEYRSPAVAMIYQGHHWVSVIGAFGDGTPSAGHDYTIEGFWVCNPAVEMTVEQVTYEGWLYEYFTGFAAYPTEQFVVVTDSRATAAGRLHLPPPAPLPGLFRGPELNHVECALRGLAEHNLMGMITSWEPFKYGSVINPLYVEALGPGEGTSPFWLIGFWAPEAITGGPSWTLVRVDAIFGTFLGAAFGLKPGAQFPPSFALDAILNDDGFVPAGGTELQRRVDALRQSLQDVRQTVVWHPSESGSPYAPFYQIGDGHNTIFVTRDGRGLTELAWH